MMVKSSKLILPLIISTLMGCGGSSTSTSEGKRTEIINEDTPLVVDIGYDILTLTIQELPKNGVLIYDLTKDQIKYTPNENFFGKDSFKINYGNDNKKEDISYDIIINSVNDAPLILMSDATIPYHNLEDDWEYPLVFSDIEDETIYFDVNAEKDNDKNSLVTIEFDGLELSGGATKEDNIVQYGEFSYNKLTHIIKHVASQTQVDYEQIAKITIKDSDGFEVTKNITFSIDYINKLPVYNGPVVFSVLEDTPLEIPIDEQIIDSDNDDYVVEIDTMMLSGSAVYANGVITYTPPANFFGEEDITLNIVDQVGINVKIPMKINVSRTIDSLTVDNFSSTINEDSIYDVQITYTDLENVPASDIKFEIKSNPTKGTISVSETGLVRYVPFANENGEDTFEINVYDNIGRKEVSLVTVSITPVNDPIELVSNIEFQTLGNIHFSSNIRAYLTDVDGDNIIFSENTYNVSGSSLTVESNGNIEFLPPVGEKNTLYNFGVEATDGELNRVFNVSVMVEDRLVKIVDLDAVGSSNNGSARNPYTNAELAFTEMNSFDEVYFCSNDITINTTVEIPSNVSMVGFNQLNKHDFINHCEIENGTETNLTISNGVELQINSDLIMRNLKLNNVSSSEIITSGDLDLSNVIMENLNVYQVSPTSAFMMLQNVMGINLKNVVLYNGDKGVEIDKVSGLVTFDNLNIESVSKALVIKEVESQSNIQIINSEIKDFDIGIDIASVLPATAIDVSIEDVKMNSILVDALAIKTSLTESRESVINVERVNVNSDTPLNINMTGSDGIQLNILNSDIATSKDNAVTVIGSESGITSMVIKGNAFNILKDLDAASLSPYIDILHASKDLTSEVYLTIESNLMSNTGNYSINSGNAINVEITAIDSPIKSVMDIKDNTIVDSFVSHLNVDYSDSANINKSSLNINNNNFATSNEKSVSLIEKNMVDSCLNMKDNNFAIIDLNNEDKASDISLYDPLNEMEVSIINRQTIISSYAPFENYGFTFNKCETNIK